MRVLHAKLLAWIVAAAAAISTPPADAQVSTTLTPEVHCRGEEQTFLTYPEWFLVHSPAELAQWLDRSPTPSAFPWGGHIAQFWQSYREVTRETARQPFNAGYHVMVLVIGASTTVEYALRSAYESTIGRLSEAAAGNVATAEDVLAARIARDYVDFIRVRPWYEFDFVTPLHDVWRLQPIAGESVLRRWERRFALTTEYAVKAGYAWLITRATQSVYDPALPETAVVVDRAPSGVSRWRLIEVRGPDPVGTVVGMVPRYQGFTAAAQAIAEQGGNFVEIAGNRGPILVTVLLPTVSPKAVEGERLLFTQPILTQPGRERRALVVSVSALAEHLRRWHGAGVAVEHVYDY